MQEEIVSRKKFRRLIDSATDKWQRISFWSKASDCVMEDENGNETTVENEIQNIRETIQNQNKLNNKLLVYNADSDSYQGYINGQWKDMYYAGFNWDGYIIKDGVLNEKICGGFCGNSFAPYLIYDGSEQKYNDNILRRCMRTYYNNTTGCLNFSCDYSKAVASSFTFFPIDLTKYNTFTIEYEYQTTYPVSSEKESTGFVIVSFVRSIGEYYEWRNWDPDNKSAPEHLYVYTAQSKTSKQFNIKNLNGFYYLAIGKYSNYNNNTNHFKLYNLHIE